MENESDISEEKMKSLRTFGSDYFKDSFLNKPKVIEPIKYGKNYLQIGRRVGSGEVFGLDIRESCRIIVLGSTRSGKSFLLRSLSDRLFNIDEVVVHLNDCKDEMKSSNDECQEKFRSGLLEGEKPQKTPVVTLRPTFFKTVDQKLPERNFWYAVDSREISQADFMTLMNSDESSPNQRTSLELLYQDIQKELIDDPKAEINYEFLLKVLNENPDIEERQKKSLRFKFKPLETSNFFDRDNVKNVVNLIKNNYIPSINMESFDSFGKGSFLYPEVTMNIVLREIIKARRKERIRRTWIMIDESSRFIGNSTSNSSSFKSAVLNSFDVDTKYGVNFTTVWQSISDVPERIMQQSRYVFVPQTADVNTIKQVLINTGLVKNIQRSVNKAIELKRKLKMNKYSWLVCDRTESRMELIIPLNVLSWHTESTR
jgi:hypothetical protein